MVCQLENAKKQPKMFKSSVDLLAQAAQHQHQLLDVLLAPQHSDAQVQNEHLFEKWLWANHQSGALCSMCKSPSCGQHGLVKLLAAKHCMIAF